MDRDPDASPALAPSIKEGPIDAFRTVLGTFGPDPALLLGHNDADGLAASAILAQALERKGTRVTIRILRRGESPWSPEIRAEVARHAPGGLIVTDLGLRGDPIAPGVPTLFVDHHVPQGVPRDAVVISGHGADPQPTSSLLAFRCATSVAPVDDLLWLAALGIIGDMAEAGGFAEMDEARRRYGITALRKAAALVNQPRRSASGDPAPALALLMKCRSPKELLSGGHPETARLIAARDEVRAALDAARKVPPRLAGSVALIRFASPCQVHPLVAQTWTGRLRDRIVLAANSGFRPGWVHFAARAAGDVDLIAFLARHAPPGADENYGSGHAKATGGALRNPDWNLFVQSLGFGPDMEIAA